MFEGAVWQHQRLRQWYTIIIYILFFFSLSLSVYFIYLNVPKGINMLRSTSYSTLSGVRCLWTNWPKILCHHIQIYMSGGCCAKWRKWNAAARESKKPSAFFDFSFKIFNFKKTSTYTHTNVSDKNEILSVERAVAVDGKNPRRLFIYSTHAVFLISYNNISEQLLYYYMRCSAHFVHAKVLNDFTTMNSSTCAGS